MIVSSINDTIQLQGDATFLQGPQTHQYQPLCCHKSNYSAPLIVQPIGTKTCSGNQKVWIIKADSFV